MALVINAHIYAVPGHRETIKAGLLKLVPPTRLEHGCHFYDLHEDQDDENHFVFFESWESKAALDKHMASDHIAAYRAASKGLVADFKMYEMRKLD